jgi:ketosteroid isomerase-like protein
MSETRRIVETYFHAWTTHDTAGAYAVLADRAVMLYDYDLVGTLRIASFFRVANGKIAAYDTRFDATNVARLRG